MKRKKHRRKNDDILLPTLPEGMTAEDIGRALVRQSESGRVVTNEAEARKLPRSD